MLKIILFVFGLVFFAGCVDDTIETDIKMAQCLKEYPNFETTQKKEFESCIK